MALQFPAIDPVALAVGPLQIRWYALAYLSGFLLGWWYALRLAARDGKISKDHIDDFLVWAVVGVIAGGRIGYVLFYNFSSYLGDPMEILRIWHGGMSFHGGALGVIAALLLFSWRKKLPLLHLSDIVCAVVPVGLFFGRIANFINGELWGRVTEAPWAFVFPYAGSQPRHPSQLYEAGLEGLVLGLILFVLARQSAIRNRPGVLTAVFLGGYGVFRFIIEFFREPDAQIGFLSGGITMGQVLCLPMMVVAALLFIQARKKTNAGA